MAENVKVLRRRVRSVKNTKQITRAMEMVSASKLRRAQALLMAGRPYASKLQELMSRVADSKVDHPLFEVRDVRRRLLVVVTADRGLAGAFNNAITKQAERYLKAAEAEGKPVELVCVGKRGYDYFRTKRWTINFSVTTMAGRLTADRAVEIADRLQELFLTRKFDVVDLVYNKFISTSTYRQTEEQLLPLDADKLAGNVAGTAAAKPAGKAVDYILEPSAESVFSSLLPRFVRSKIYISLAESFTAEHSARMLAMNGATKNCQELIDKLTLDMNKVRQAAITKEILEVVGGAEALN